MSSKMSMRLLLAVLLHLSRPTEQFCDNENIFTETCKQYCDSKRKPGETGEFYASCENGNIRTQYRCLGKCMKNDCPCGNCPNGNYVKCPALPPPTTPSPPPPPPAPPAPDPSSGFKTLLIVLGVILLLAACAGVGIGIFCCTKSRRHTQQVIRSQANLRAGGQPSTSASRQGPNNPDATPDPVSQVPQFDYPVNI